MELIGLGVNAAIMIAAALITGFFAQRVNVLEKRIDELEIEQHGYWMRERKLIDFIYRNNLTPPTFEKEKSNEAS